MNKSVKGALLALPLITALLYSAYPSSGQQKGTIRLQKTAEVKREKKVAQPSGQALVNSPDVAVLPDSDGKKSTAPSTAQTQTAEPQAPSPQDPCTFTLMVTGEVNELVLVVSVGCIMCTLPSTITHSNAGIIGLSMSPNGPWTEEITVMTTLNAQGQGTSEPFYVKGEAEGTTIFHAQNFFASSDTEFRVVPCSCPEIPIVP